jgi:hypothetical protein
LKRLESALAFLSSLAALILIAGGGLALLAIRVSGERGMGALLALCSGIAFAAVMALLFARLGSLGEGWRKAAAIAAAIVGAAPPAVITFLALRFAGNPFGSRVPLLEWSVLGIGIFFGLGALSILALGHRRSQEQVEPIEDIPIVHMQQIRHAQQQLRSAFEADRVSPRMEDLEEFEDDVRVRRVEGPLQRR